MSDFDEDVEELKALLDWQYPDDVDLLEDALAAEIGLHRFPGDVPGHLAPASRSSDQREAAT